MSRCIWCNEEVIHTVSIKELILFHCKKKPFCSACSSQLKRLDNEKQCRGCSRMSEEEEICQDCLLWRKQYPHIELNHRAVYAYNAFAKEIVSQYKFLGDCELAAVFSEEMKELTLNCPQPSLTVPIPISRQSLESRGFNQTELLLAYAKVDYQQVLDNSFQHEKQSKKNRSERLQSPQPFTVKEGLEGVITDRHVIIVDDIYTTGRTIYHAANLLSQYNPASISSISLFR